MAGGPGELVHNGKDGIKVHDEAGDMYVCMYVCMYVYTYIHTHMYIHTYIHICTYITGL
jgi:hypothetical protein